MSSDGDVRLLIPSLIEAGITALQPLKSKANMDVRALSGILKGVEKEVPFTSGIFLPTQGLRNFFLVQS
jgi:hypothetical protein